MIIPSIDLMGGRAVQLISGEKLEIDAGDPKPIATKFGLAGDVAVIDLDAAKGEGENGETIRELLRHCSCRVGGGIRSVERAVAWLDAGASKIIIGTAATPELLRELPAERVIVALDERDGAVVDQGWRNSTGRNVLDRMRELQGLAGGFLVTFVEVEGSMQGLPVERIAELVAAAGDARVTVAGGVSSVEDIAEADRLGADVQVGMALYSGRVDLADALTAPLRTDRDDGLWPTVVCDEAGVALGLVYSSAESVREAVKLQRGVYYSRSRQEIWRKGESSGATQQLLRITPDCDRDALRFTVRQEGTGFCHTGDRTCFGSVENIGWLYSRLRDRLRNAPPNSYTARLASEPGLLRAKLVEEAGELADATTPDEVTWEAADLLYFTLVAMAQANVSPDAVQRMLADRSRKVTRRPGNAKEPTS
ncbi:MAG: phosphoribosyl-ATP diphosphatase [Planctomycetota bacterium]